MTVPVKPAVRMAIDQFPARFGLRSMGKANFRINEQSSYIDESYKACPHTRDDKRGPQHDAHNCPEPQTVESVQLVVQVYSDTQGTWLDFTRTTPAELQEEVVR